MNKKKIAIVTGASSGIGKEFAKRVCAEYRVDELWAVARSREKLAALEEELDIKVRSIPCDLTDKNSILHLETLLKQETIPLDVLVYAAGYGKFGAFVDIPLEEQLDMMELNNKALVALSYKVIPFMAEGGKIFMLGSLSSFQPVPYISVYGASKAFVLSFSRALNRELRNKGIRVLAVSPGWVKTAFFDRAVRDDTIVYYNKFYTPKQVVDRAIKDMRKGKEVSICGLLIRAQVLFTKLMPHKAIMAIWCMQQKK